MDFEKNTETSLGWQYWTLDDNLPQYIPRNDERTTHKTESTVTIGVLNRLPAELLYILFPLFDLWTLNAFRCVNSRALDIVELLPEYIAIKQHALNALRGILCIQVGRAITCRELYDTLCSDECENCGEFGEHIYLFSCQRVCYHCLAREERFLPLSSSRAKRKFGLDNTTLKTLPTMRIKSGIYTLNSIKTKSVILFDCGDARAAGIKLHGSEAEMRKFVREQDEKDMNNYLDRVNSARLSLSMSSVRKPAGLEYVDDQERNPLRFVAVSVVPSLDLATKRVEFGRYCTVCIGYRILPLSNKRRYSPKSFDVHIQELEGILRSIHSQIIQE